MDNIPDADPEPKFKVGDAVTFTNDQGVRFEGRRVTGLYGPGGFLYRYGYRYRLNNDAHWMPVREANLTHASIEPGQ